MKPVLKSLPRWACLWLAGLVLSGCGNNKPAVSAPALGEPAPEFTFVNLTDGSEEKLSSLRGKIVVADFWASWCGPCQEPMAKMQTYREKHSEWGEDVVLLAVSIDDTAEAARDHLEERGWNRTRNVWADPHGGDKPAVVAYAGKGIPACYVVDPEGVIVKMGHPGEMDLPAIIAGLLSSS